jgi:hypothetical protein
MNLALSTGAAAAFAAGAAGDIVGGLACASAPETISVPTAADIMRVFNMSASKRVCKRVCSAEEKRKFLTHDNSRAGPVFRAARNWGGNVGNDLRTAAHSADGNAMSGRRSFQFRLVNFLFRFSGPR